MTPKITRFSDDVRRALHDDPARPLPVQDQDDQSHRVYYIVTDEALPGLWEEYVRHEVNQGLAAIDSGDIVDWNPEKIKAEGRRRRSSQESPQS